MAPRLEVQQARPQQADDRSDITAFPEVIREFEPSKVDGEPGKVGFKREFRVERDGRTIVYSVSRLARRQDGQPRSEAREAERLVTVFVETERPDGAQFSQRKTGPAPGSPSTGLNRIQDTAPEALASPRVGQEPSPTPSDIGRNREEINDVARRESNPERDATADFEASRRAEEALQEVPAEIDETSAQAEADFVAEQVEELRRQGLLDPALERELDGLNELVDQAETISRATRGAALCLTRP